MVDLSAWNPFSRSCRKHNDSLTLCVPTFKNQTLCPNVYSQYTFGHELSATLLNKNGYAKYVESLCFTVFVTPVQTWFKAPHKSTYRCLVPDPELSTRWSGDVSTSGSGAACMRSRGDGPVDGNGDGIHLKTATFAKLKDVTSSFPWRVSEGPRVYTVFRQRRMCLKQYFLPPKICQHFLAHPSLTKNSVPSDDTLHDRVLIIVDWNLSTKISIDDCMNDCPFVNRFWFKGVNLRNKYVTDLFRFLRFQ